MDYIYQRKMMEGLALVQQQAALLKAVNREPIPSQLYTLIQDTMREHSEGKSPRIPQFKAVEEDLADLLIAVMSYAGETGLSVASATVAKLKYNHKLSSITKP